MITISSEQRTLTACGVVRIQLKDLLQALQYQPSRIIDAHQDKQGNFYIPGFQYALWQTLDHLKVSLKCIEDTMKCNRKTAVLWF